MRRYHILVFALTVLALGLWSVVPGNAQSKAGAFKPMSPLSPKAASGEQTEKIKEASRPATLVFPSIAEVVPNESQLAKAAAEVKELIAEVWNMAVLNGQITNCEAKHEKMKESIGRMGNPENWDLSRLTDARVLILKDRKQIEALVTLVLTKLSNLESIREEWEKKQSFWQEWRISLIAAKVELPVETFDKVQESTSAILQNVSNTAKLLITIQQKASRLLEENLQVSAPIEAAQSKMRSETFKRIEPSFVSEDFFAQLNSSLWPTAFENLAGALKAEDDFHIKQTWSILARIIIILAIGLLVPAHRNRTVTEAGSGYLLNHPWALGVFVAEIIFAVTSHELSGLGRHLAFLLFSFSAWTLLPSISKDRRERFILLFLATLVASGGIAKLISLPSPLYRLASASFSIAGAIFFWTLASRNRRLACGRLSIFTAGCMIGTLVMLTALISQASGLVNLSDRLIFSSSGMFFLGLAAALLLHIGNFTIDAALTHSGIGRYRLISRFGAELGVLLKRMFKLILYGLSVLQLFRIWGVYTSTGQAAEKLLEYRISLGSLTLSLGLIVSVLLVFYCSRSISWFVRAVLETEVFPRKNVDRGAGHAISKLVHYSFVLTGLVIGLNLTGIDLKTFVVLGGALGIGIGFGMQNIVNNFISGLILLFERPVKVGDIVMVGNEQGRIQRIGLRSTIIDTFDRSELIVPNANFISQNVINWTHSNSVARLKIQVCASYGSDIELVLAVLRETGEKNPRVLLDPAPLSLMVRFGESGFDCELQVWLADVAERSLAQREISQEIAKRFRDLGLEIASPQMDLHLRSIQAELAGAIRGTGEGVVPSKAR
ncbi:MAG: mechanosensitive ion channel family protein [Syntrophobacteraceae bacterium]